MNKDCVIDVNEFRKVSDEFGITMNNSGDTVNIDNAELRIWPGNATRDNIGTTWDPGDMGNGGNNTALESNIVIFNSATTTAGAMTFNNLLFRLTVNDTLPAEDFDGTLTLVVE